MAGRLQDKVALVTGAGSVGEGWGNGKAVAVQFAREGAKVVACDINGSAANETCALIRGEGGSCEVYEGDVSSSVDVAAMVALCVSRFGRLDVLHNNVGIFKIGNPPDLPEQDWEQVMATNLRSLYLTCRHALPIMQQQGGGSIINIGSIAGVRFMGLPTIAYATTKGAVISFTQTIAAQYGAYGIRANCIAPGIIDTPLMRISSGDAYTAQFGAASQEAMHAARAAAVPLRRLGSAWDVAHASVFLASDEASYVTGAVLMVDGGLSLTTSATK